MIGRSKALETLIVLKAVDKASAGINKMFSKANARSDKFARRQKERSARFAAAGMNMITMAAGIGTALYQPTKLAVDFEQAISNVGAVSGATNAQLEAMAQTARKQGRITMFTANQSAEAMMYLAMAGLNVKDNMEALPGVLNLAAAGNLDLGQTADIATNIMSGFRMEAKDMAYIGNVLTRTFTSSNSTLDSVAATMKYAAPIAAAVGTDIGQLAAMTGRLASAGIKGQMAGTALRGIMLRLAGPTKASAEALAELGVQTVDMNGNLRDVPTLLAEIGTAMDKLPSGRRMGLMKAIFETEGTSAATALMASARTGDLQGYAAAISGTDGSLIARNTAAGVADRRMDTTMGDMLRFKSAMQDLGISIGNTLLPSLATLAEHAASAANKMSDWAQANPKLTGTIVKVVAGGAALLAVLGSIALTIAAVSSTMGVLAPVLTAIGGGIAAVIGFVGGVPIAIAAAIGLAGYMLYKHWDKVKDFMWKAKVWMLKAGKNLAEALGKGLRMTLGGPLSPFAAIFDAVQMVRDLLPSSPAKRGPLSDLHKLKFGETIAKSMKPQPMVDQMTSILDTTVQAAPATQGASMGASATINYSPTINITGASEEDKQSFADMLREHSDELMRMIDMRNAHRARLAY